VQIENALTAHPEIREAAAIAVPDAKYGEVVGVWIVREPHTRISKDDVKICISQIMNPQVRILLAFSHALLSGFCPFLGLIIHLECAGMGVVC
jgi:acyl-CoA synthetase (AMP-forming)/AMP-acid ligase II